MKMCYHIRVKGKDKEYNIIASFNHEADRDVCLDSLEEYWPDAEFDVIEDDD